MPLQRRVVAAWPEVVGAEVARNTQPRTLRGGRLTVATSSSVWSQTLQLMAEEIVAGLNAALRETVVKEVLFRPAGWDPRGALPADDVSFDRGGQDRFQPPPRALTRAEEEAVEAVRKAAPEPSLGDRIAGAMRAALGRLPAPPEGGEIR